jgi:adenine-specific DNA-methyltransferase
MKLLKPNGVMCITIDDYEIHHLRNLVEDMENTEVLGTAVIKTSPSGRPSVRGFRVNHEYAMFVAKSKDVEIGRLEKSEEQMALFTEQDEQGSFDWVNLRKRGGANTLRPARPKQFYPIYVKDETIRVPELKWNKANKAWDVLESPSDGEEIIFPYGNDGQERIWAFGHETTRGSISDLQVRKNKDGKISIYRKLRPGEGSLPSTVWDKAEYSIIENGTVLLEKILGEKQKFPFPKSLNAVVDCLRVSGATKRDALIIDFFAGSGTTLHATMMLNTLDEGQRKCILVTNNEVNEAVAKQLNAQELWPGDPEFEILGICESVTWPRLKYAVNGMRDDKTLLEGTYANGQELKEGFEENIEYFRLDFLDPHEVAYGEKLEAILPILWLMAGAKGQRETDKGEKVWFIPKSSPFAVLIDEHAFSQFKQAIANRPDLTHIFLVTDSLEAYRSMIAQLPEGIHTKMLYKSYLDNFKINIEQNL